MTRSIFTPELFRFLEELEQNNEREWFEDNKDRYEEHVREPARAFVRAMGPRLLAISPHYVASDKKVGGSLMRVHRDVRFGKDKSPYKTNVGIQFRHDAGKDVHAPGLYLHIAPSERFIGVGTWKPDPPSLQAIREAIDRDREGWRKVRDEPAFRAVYDLAGDSIARPPRGVAKDHPYVEDLMRKDHIAGADISVEEILSPGVVGIVSDRFAKAGPYLGFLARALGLPF